MAVAGFSFFAPLLPIFNGEKYEWWSIKMKTLLRSQELWDLVEYGFVDISEPTIEEEETLRETKKNDVDALFIIQQAVHETIFSRIAAATTSKQAWSILLKEFQGDSKVITVKLQSLRSDFETLLMMNGESIADFLSRTMAIVSQMRTYGEKISDETIVAKVLRSLTPKFDHVVTTIEEATKDLSILSVDELMGLLQAHESRINKSSERNEEKTLQVETDNNEGNERENIENALQVETTNNEGNKRENIEKTLQVETANNEGNEKENVCLASRSCGREGFRSFHGDRDNRWRSDGQRQFNEQRNVIQCYHCRRYGHTKSDCWYKNQRMNFAAENEEEEEKLFVACMDTNPKEGNLWFVDSGCSNHMTGTKSLFKELDETQKIKVQLGNTKEMQVEGKGTVKVETSHGKIKQLDNVQFVPDLGYNLLSVGQLMTRGHSVLFDDNTCVITDKKSGHKVQSAMTSNKMFPLDISNMEDFALTASIKDDSTLWHLRYGHLHMNGLKILRDKGMVFGLPRIDSTNLCEGCIYGKQTRKSFPVGKVKRASHYLELIHADLCGPMQTKSLGGSIYFLLFVDDYSRMSWVYFLQHKSETFQKFQIFKAMVENQSGCHIKVLRTDRGGEFISKDFNLFCEEEGIQRELTAPYTPEQNGIAERKNRTIVEMARSMLQARRLPNQFWAEAVATSVYLLNISPTKAVMNRTPYEAWHGRKPSLAPNSTESLGVVVLKSRGIFPEARWYWIGVAATIGYILLFNFLFTIALKYLDPFGKPQAILSSKESSTEKSVKKSEDVQEGNSSYNAERSENEVSLSSRTSSARVGSINEADRNKKRGMVLPFEPHTITFDEIRYAVDMPQEMKSEGVTEDRLELLKGVSGSFRPGVLTALMGVSGAGKTTLMDVLAGRKTGGYIDGNITISGYPKNQETFARISGYCEQTDIHSPHVTVYESLVYSAWLRLPPDVDNATRKMFVEEVMNLIELNPIRDSIVGLPGVNGLSTEQRKRLTIAVELVANPSIIFMDEPTSGLDARAAAIVMRTVRNTVDTGRTVVCTIHQPSIDIFDAFDELFLLRRGGEEIYVGPIGRHSIHLIDYFESIEGVPKIKDGYNPATWMLEVTTASQEANLGVNFNTLYKKSELFRRNKDLIKQLSVPSENSKELYFPTKYSQSFVVQCIACLWKQHLSYWRNPSYSAVRFLFTTIIALMFGTIFWDLGSKRDNQQDLFNAMGSMYAAVLFVGVQNATSVQPVVAIERTVFYREKAAGMYSALPYAFGQVVIELPYIFIQTIVYGVIVYGMIGFEWTAAKFFWYIFFMYFTLLYFTFYGMMTVAVTPNHNIAAIVSSAFYGFWNLFSGFIIPRTKIPIWWRWYYWICPVAWTLYGLVTSQFGDIEDRMDSNQTVAEFVRSYFGYKYDFLGIVAAVHVGFTVLFGFIFAFSIKVFNFQNR